MGLQQTCCISSTYSSHGNTRCLKDPKSEGTVTVMIDIQPGLKEFK